MPAFVGYEAISTGTRKSAPDMLSEDRSLCRQLDELERISTYERDKFLGKTYFSDIADFINLDYGNENVPSFRPLIRIPQLQQLVLTEATDITDSSPKIYISNGDKQQKEMQQFYQTNWKRGHYNNRILESLIWAMLSNLGYLEIGVNPLARRGKGNVWVSTRRPDSVFPDPFCTDDTDWTWVQWEDWTYIDDIYRRFPEKGHLVRPHMYASDSGAGASDPYGSTGQTLEFPEASPLSNQGSTQDRKIFRDNRVRLRHTFLFDNTREKVKDYAGSRAESLALVHPRFQYTYPDGRWLTDCENVVLADGNNWCPQLPDDERGTFPLIRIKALPTLTNFWGPPPVKFTQSIQNTAERIYSQVVENVIRLNNGVIVIQNNSGLSADAIGWLPGEVLTINAGSQPPQVIHPQPMGQDHINLPMTLLALQKELQGFNQARQGQSGGGNVSPDLFDASLWQGQSITRLRARMLSESIERLANIVFYVMAHYKIMPDRLFSGAGKDGEPEYSKWTPVPFGEHDNYDAALDENSLSVLSGTALKSVIAALGKAQMLPTRTILEEMGVPNAAEIAEERMRELELQSAAKLKRPK